MNVIQELDQRTLTYNLLKAGGTLRLTDLLKAGVYTPTLASLISEGIVVRPGRGCYQLADDNVVLPPVIRRPRRVNGHGHIRKTVTSSNHILARASELIPKGVVCLISALQFHNLTLQTPTMVWMAVDQTSREQDLNGQALRVLKFAGRKFSDGIGWHRIDDRDIKVYNPAKTIVDCFVFRQKIGLSVFFEGLRQGLSRGSVTPEQLYQYSQPSAVWPVLQQYVKTVASDIG